MSFSPSSSLLQSVFSFLLLSSSFLVGPALARDRHVITIAKPDLLPSTLAWDPSAQHFLVGSLLRPSISSVSDAGVIETLISDPLLPASSPVSAIALDASRRRLLVAFSSPSSLIAAYDLRSPRPHSRLFASPLPDPSAAIASLAVDSSSGTGYATGSANNQIWAVDLEGRVSEIPLSASGLVGERGLGGVAHVNRGFLLAVEEGAGRIWKVMPEEGAAKEVLLRWRPPAEAELAMRSDGKAVVAGNRTVRMLQSEDGWMEAAAVDEVAVEKGRVRGVAVREGKKVYVLVGPEEEEEEEKRWRIEEMEWESEKEGDMVWGLVLVVLGMAYFLYWRFQMGQLATNLNKKRA